MFFNSLNKDWRMPHYGKENKMDACFMINFPVMKHRFKKISALALLFAVLAPAPPSAAASSIDCRAAVFRESLRSKIFHGNNLTACKNVSALRGYFLAGTGKPKTVCFAS